MQTHYIWGAPESSAYPHYQIQNLNDNKNDVPNILSLCSNISRRIGSKEEIREETTPEDYDAGGEDDNWDKVASRRKYTIKFVIVQDYDGNP